jgi:RHS repeat-associated protein
MEVDPETKGNGNSYTTEFRQYDPRLGRWLSLDPLMASFPWQSPYCAFDNSPIYKIDKDGQFSIEVIKRDDGKMELRIVTTGYLMGSRSQKIMEDFHNVYPEGYSNSGTYIDKNGVEWVISVTIDLDLIENADVNQNNHIVDTDCEPPPGWLEASRQGGFDVCGGLSGLVLHGLWHNTGGDDCDINRDPNCICNQTGIMNNPNIRTIDFWQIGYKLIDDVPETINMTENKRGYTVAGFIEKKTDKKIFTDGTRAYFWDKQFPGGSSKLIEEQVGRLLEKNPIKAPKSVCNSPSESPIPTEIEQSNEVIIN